jgi:hypothetical protein
MQFEGEFDEAVDQLRIGQPGSLLRLGIHADGGEAGNGVEFIDKTCEGLFAKLHNPMNNLTAKVRRFLISLVGTPKRAFRSKD